MEEAIKHPTQESDCEYIKKAISEMKTFIRSMEKRNALVLYNDRLRLLKIVGKWRASTKWQICYECSNWQSEIMRDLINKKLTA